MYDQFVSDFKALLPEFPAEPDLDLGFAIKHIRLRMGLTQEELARDARMNLSALKTLENGYAKFTTISNLEVLSHVLRVPLREILLEAREWFPGNFFVLKLGEPSTAGTRKRKRREEIWFKRKNLTYNGFRIDLSSPPLRAPAHFCLAILEIAPGKEIPRLKLRYPNQVVGFVERGTLKIVYGSNQEMNLFGNQGFALRGDKTHRFINLDMDNTLRLVLAFHLAPSKTLAADSGSRKDQAGVSAGKAIHRIRELYSDSKERLLTFAELSYLTGLEEKSLQYLENTTQADQVVYWDKVEKITQALKMPFTRFLDLAEGKDEGSFSLATAHDRALIDYRHYLGVRIKSTVFPSTGNIFHMSEMYIEPRGGIRRVTWKRTDNARIAVYIEDGELRVEVGKNRKVNLQQGESVYFDGSLGYIFTNPGSRPCKLFIATHPPIIF